MIRNHARASAFALAMGFLIECAPAYVLLLPRLFGAGGYVLVFFALAGLVGAVSASLSGNLLCGPTAAGTGKLISDTLLGWQIGQNVIGHAIEITLVCCVAFASGWFWTRFGTTKEAAGTSLVDNSVHARREEE